MHGTVFLPHSAPDSSEFSKAQVSGSDSAISEEEGRRLIGFMRGFVWRRDVTLKKVWIQRYGAPE